MRKFAYELMLICCFIGTFGFGAFGSGLAIGITSDFANSSTESKDISSNFASPTVVANDPASPDGDGDDDDTSSAPVEVEPKFEGLISKHSFIPIAEVRKFSIFYREFLADPFTRGIEWPPDHV